MVLFDLLSLGCGIYKGYNDSAGNYVGTLPVFIPIATYTLARTVAEARGTTGKEKTLETLIKDKKFKDWYKKRESKKSQTSKAVRGTFTGLMLSSLEVGLGYFIGSVIQKQGL